MSETERLVKVDAARVFGLNPTDKNVIVLLPCHSYDLKHELAPETLTMMIFVHIDRVLNRVLVSRPSSKRAVADKAQKLSVGRFDANNGESAGLLGFKPRGHRFQRARLVVKERGRREYRFVENVQDLRCVPVVRAVDDLHDGVVAGLGSGSRVRSFIMRLPLQANFTIRLTLV